MKRLAAVIIFFNSCASPTSQPQSAAKDDNQSAAGKINGVSLAAPPRAISENEFSDIAASGANYVCLLPFAFMRSHQPNVYFNSTHQWWGETPQGISECVRLAHDHGMKVMIKPQIWMHDYFTGNITFQNENDWKQFERDYTAYIFSFVEVADTMHAEMFCIGTELDSFVLHRPQYWSHLIDTIRSVYHGQITYAENWDCYSDFPLWNKLDYIGINAYFPLSDASTPAVNELAKGWKKYCEPMHALSEKTGKPVVFTEFGYRSVDYCAKQPWDAYDNSKMNYLAQQNAYEALFHECWNQQWFAGGFCWKWFSKNNYPDVTQETDYTPQGKPAAQVLKNWYSAQ